MFSYASSDKQIFAIYPGAFSLRTRQVSEALDIDDEQLGRLCQSLSALSGYLWERVERLHSFEACSALTHRFLHDEPYGALPGDHTLVAGGEEDRTWVTNTMTGLLEELCLVAAELEGLDALKQTRIADAIVAELEVLHQVGGFKLASDYEDIHPCLADDALPLPAIHEYLARVEDWDTSLLDGVGVDARVPAVIALMGLFATAEVISSAIALGTTRNNETLVYEPEEILDLVAVNEDCSATERVAAYGAGLVAVGFHLLDVAHLLFTPGRDTLDYGPSGEQAVDEITSLCEPDDLPSPEEFCAAAMLIQQRLVDWYSGMHSCFVDSPVTLSPHDVPLQSRGRIGELLDMIT